MTGTTVGSSTNGDLSTSKESSSCMTVTLQNGNHQQSKTGGVINNNSHHIVYAANSTTAATDNGRWTIGLINSKYKYLSGETFGFRTNANGKALKKKQIWILEPSGDGETVVIRSHLNKYLAVDQFGNVTCDQDERDETSKFEISVCEDFSGRWAFKSLTRGYFLGATPESLVCRAKAPASSELWYVHLAARPQINLRSVGRKRFAHLSKDGQDEIQVGENVPWGEATLFTLEFREDVNKYAIHTCNNMYLCKNGTLTTTVIEDCHFAVEYHGGFIALRDIEGQYLAPIGSRAILKTRSLTVTKDELFSLEDSLPQASFLSKANSNKFVSVKQGVDATANQGDVSDNETFQLEFDCPSQRWYIRTMQDKYFVLDEISSGIQATGSIRSENALFDIKWHSDGSISFKASNSKYLATKKSGHLFANCDTDGDDRTRFFFYLVNRPVLVLKCDQGFVGHRSSSSNGLTHTSGNTSPCSSISPSASPPASTLPSLISTTPMSLSFNNILYKLECNKATYEMIHVERGPLGKVYLKAQGNGKYLSLESDESGNLTADDEEARQSFYMELRDPTKMCIKNEQGLYLNSQTNGGIALSKTSDASKATLWEY